MTDERWTKIWDAFTGDPMDPKNNTEAGLRRVVELLDGTPSPETHLRVKPLEWVPVIEGGRDIQSVTEFGTYTISIDSSFAGGTHYLWTPDQRGYDDDHHSEHRGMTSARAAAQADYESRANASPLSNTEGDIPRLPVGTPVRFFHRYPFTGTVVSTFHTLSGQERFVVEATGEAYRGMLHIFNGDQLRATTEGQP